MHTHVQLVVHQDSYVIFCKTAFYTADTQPILLHGFMPSALGALQVTDHQLHFKTLTATLWAQAVQWVFHLVCSFPLDLTHAVASWQSMVAKECSLICGIAHNHFALFSFITATYLFMLFFSWHPLSCICPWLPNFDYRSWDFIRKKMWLFFSLLFCYYIDK